MSFLLIFLFLSAKAEDKEEYLALVNATDSIFIKNSLCKSSGDCSNKEFVKFRRIENGVQLNIYGVKDLKLVSELTSAIINEYQSKSMKIVVQVSYYKISHAESIAGMSLINNKQKAYSYFGIAP